jgi:hypothetical protein
MRQSQLRRLKGNDLANAKSRIKNLTNMSKGIKHLMKANLTTIFGLFILSLTSDGQASNKTFKYAGTYSYGADIEKGGTGTFLIYPETDSTILFYVYLNRGAPSYNMGSLYGRVIIKEDSGIFYSKFDYSNQGCAWTLKFSTSKLIVKTLEGDCGFGGAVYADGDFRKVSKKVDDHFEDMEGKIIYFKSTKPEEYYKN